jgi:hypothetical protein
MATRIGDKCERADRRSTQQEGGKRQLSAQGHIVSLEKKHQDLEDELRAAMAHSSSDDRTIADIKRRKLQVKDELARLKSAAARQ